jgi:UDP-N-acetylmuramyl pentapeptide synthase
VDRVFTFGPNMLHLQQALPRERAAGHYATRAELARAVLAELRGGDVVTVKASVPSNFPELVQILVRAADRRG